MTNKSVKHSPNCDCYSCTGGDSYLKEVRRRYGKNANFSMAARSGVYGSTGGFNHADAPPAATAPIAPEQVDIKKLLGNALGTFVGDVIQAKKDGQTLPGALDKVATLGIATEKAAVNAAQGKAEQTIGQKVLKFSPYIVGGIIAIVLGAVFFMGKK